LIVDAMAGIQDDAKDEPVSVPLMVVENGCGSPCIDFRQVSSELAAAAKDADLVRRLSELFELNAFPCMQSTR
jgi:type II pantothenate kinase